MVIPRECLQFRMERKTISVTGMSCNGCEQNVETALRNLDGVNRVEADHDADTVDVVLEDEVSDDEVNAAIEQAGYDVVA
jgi:copper chaperone